MQIATALLRLLPLLGNRFVHPRLVNDLGNVLRQLVYSVDRIGRWDIDRRNRIRGTVLKQQGNQGEHRVYQ